MYISACIGAAAIVLLLLKIKRRKTYIAPEAFLPDVPETVPVPVEEDIPAETVPESESLAAPVKEKRPRRNNSIYLFGGFAAITRDGRNITSNFSPMQQKLFCVVLHYSPSGGITTSRLSAILWPDRSGDSIKNLRNATFNHLRKSLTDIKGVSVVYKNGSYSIAYEDGFYCDYLRFREIADSEPISDSDMEELVCILSRGSFIERMEDMSLDPIKENVGQMVMRSLPPVVKELCERKRYADVITCCEILFRIDPFNDFALKYYVSALCRMKRTDEALLRYSSFIVEYRKTYEEDYPYRFDDLQKS